MNLKQMWSKVDGYKTYAVAIATVLYAVLYYGLDQHDWGTAATMALGAGGLGALRHGMGK